MFVKVTVIPFVEIDSNFSELKDLGQRSRTEQENPFT